MTASRRSFLGWAATLPLWRGAGAAHAPVIEARPTALYQQPDGRRNLVRITVAGLGAPAARARVIDRRGALVGTAGLLPAPEGLVLTGEVWVPLSEPADFQVDVEVGRDRVARRRLRLTPPKRWTVYWLAAMHTAVGYTDLQDVALETHRRNLDAALARLTTYPEHRWTAECTLHILSYLENRSPEAGDALVAALRDGKIGFGALFANLLTGVLSHETFARAVWPAGSLARERGLTYAAAQITGVPGQTATFPMLLAASGVKYLASGVDAERAVPLLAAPEGAAAYPQVYYWEGPDGSRVLHWRALGYGDATRLAFSEGPDAMGRRLSDWLLTQPAFLGRDWPYDLALVLGADAAPNAPLREQVVANVAEFSRRYMFPRIVPGRAEDFFRELERRHGPRIPVRRGDTGLYQEEGAAAAARELATFRAIQLAARAAEIAALWDGRIEPRDADLPQRLRRRAEERAVLWRDLLLFGEHTFGSAQSGAAPDSRQTVAQWSYKRGILEAAAAAARQQLHDGLLRIGRGTAAGRGRLVFNASSWERTDVTVVPAGAGKSLSYNGAELPAVDLPGGDALVLARDVPPLGYIALVESDREPRLPSDQGEGLEAKAGGFAVALDETTGAVRSLTGPDGKDRVKPSPWSGLNQLVYARGAPEQIETVQARLVRARREALPGIGARLVAERALDGFSSVVSTVTLYDELPWVDFETRLTKAPTLEREALYVAFPFALAAPAVEVEVPLGRMTVEQGQQAGSCRDWYCHAHWVWLREGADGILWSGPDTPLFTLNDLVRGAWRRTIAPDGTLFAYAMNNYRRASFPARQGGSHVFRFRVSLLAPGDAAEPARRGWAACDPLYASPSYETRVPGPLIGKDRALFLADKNVMVVGAKPADDGDGAIVKLLDVAGQARPVGLWPAAYAFRLARRTNLVEMNGDALPVGGDGKATVEVAAWGIAAARLFTPAERSG